MMYLGLDLGQAGDYTALAVAEQVPVKGGDPMFHVRHLQRFALQTTYPDLCDQVAAMTKTKDLAGKYLLLPDATGVGRPVVDMLRKAGLHMVPITITGGDDVGRNDIGLTVPKRDLVSSVLVLLQSSRLKFAEGLPDVRTLINELLAFRAKISDAGHDSYGAWRESAHDDLVLAVAMAAWYATRHQSWVRGPARE